MARTATEQLGHRIVRLLENSGQRHLTANEIAEKLDSSWSEVYKTLKTLERAGQVRKEPIKWLIAPPKE